MSCTMSLFLLRSLSLCVCGWVPTTQGAPHRQGRQTQLLEAAGVSHSLITAMTGNVLIDARKNIFLVYSHVPNIFEDSDMIVFQTQRGVPYWHGQWKFKQTGIFKSFNCVGARLLHVLSFKHTSPPLVSLVSAFKTKTTLSSVRFFLHWERGFHRKVHNPCPPLKKVLSYPLDRACLTG